MRRAGRRSHSSLVGCKDVESGLRDEFAEEAPPGTTIETRKILILEARYPNGGGMGREMECSHAEIAQLLRSSA